MRKGVALILATAAVSLLPGSTGAAAADRVLRIYEGSTSAGGRVVIFSSVRNGVVRFQGIGLDDVATCADGTKVSFAHGVDLQPRGLPMTSGAFELQHIGFSDAFTASGTLGTRAGTGTVTHLFAALDASERPHLCSTGELTWTVQRVGTETSRSDPTLVTSDVTLAESRDGVIELSRLAAGPTGAGDALRVERLRSYEGRTSARFPLFFVTSTRDGNVVLHELGIAWELTCGDGSLLALGVFIFLAGEPLDPGRVDYDVSVPEIALHVNGRLGPHAGEGTTRTILPALTSDLQAQACDSGDTSWRAWRTDPGA